MTAAANNLGRINITDPDLLENTSFAGRINGNITGEIHVGKLYRFDVDRSINARVRAVAPGLGLFDVRAGAVAHQIVVDTGNIFQVIVQGNCSGSIEATTGSVGTATVGGNLPADVLAKGGSIAPVTVTGTIGTIGTSGAWRNIYARDGIDSILADSIWADINAQHLGSGSLYRLVSSVGDFARASRSGRGSWITRTPSGARAWLTMDLSGTGEA